ncbi:MAG: hypothetical protein ALECFALPRED_011135 [Alectoria fallacina]|uniref:Uncharacterized protein n=1 Tax=Alectoria fallacina TaxID=1903189 RepID=A0A8H3J9N4_9LECA|nr:MAG: hypothetical protein ALECFALPRED_011135 [Alectoria fallacina]
MPNPFTLPPPPPPSLPESVAPMPDITPRAKVPSFATRRAACTHLTMERLYGDFTCNVCSRFSYFGWVYCCTQDDVPQSQATRDSISEISSPPHEHVNGGEKKANGVDDPCMTLPAVNEDPRLGEEDVRMPTAELSPCIENAIKDGHYTPEQVDKLRAQKQHVVDTARAAIDHFDQSQTNNNISPPQASTTLQSVDANPHLPFPVINEVQEPSVTGSTTTNVALVQQSKIRMFPFCKFCACQLCRPTHRDRAWQRFEVVFEEDHEIPFIHYEDSNRPMASASLLSKIGLRPPRLSTRPVLRSLDSRALYSRNEAGQIFFSNNNNRSYRKSADPTSSSTDIADMKIELESKGFRESMKRAFKSMLMTRRPSSRSILKRKAREGTDTTNEDTVEFDMGLWKELNDELLKEASDVPLPGKDSIERLSKEVAEMGVGGVGGVEGVAVTEEAADLGRADVIMSA